VSTISERSVVLRTASTAAAKATGSTGLPGFSGTFEH